MEANAIDVVENVLGDRTAYEKTVYLLKYYKDLMTGQQINEKYRSVLSLMDKVIELIQDDEYADIIKMLYVKGYTYEETADRLGMDKKTVYRQRRRLVKRISVILYGDRAL